MIITSLSNAPVTSPNARVTAAAELLEILQTFAMGPIAAGPILGSRPQRGTAEIG